MQFYTLLYWMIFLSKWPNCIPFRIAICSSSRTPPVSHEIEWHFPIVLRWCPVPLTATGRWLSIQRHQLTEHEDRKDPNCSGWFSSWKKTAIKADKRMSSTWGGENGQAICDSKTSGRKPSKCQLPRITHEEKKVKDESNHRKLYIVIR